MANVQTDCSIPAQRKQYRYRYYVAARSRAFLVEAGGKFFIFLFRQYGIVKQIDSTCKYDCKGKCKVCTPPPPPATTVGYWGQFSARNNHGGNILISPPALCIVYRAPYFTLLVTTVVDLAWILNFLSSRSGSYYTSIRRQNLSKLY